MNPSHRRHSGFTLMELLVSIAIFILLGLLLVSLLRGGVKIWDQGESRRDAYERASILFDTLRADISCATIHREPDPAGVHPNFSCLPDKHARPLLFFTRVGLVPPQGTLAAPKDFKDKDVQFFVAPDTMSRQEVIYCFDTSGDSARLYRGQFPFTSDYGLKMPYSYFDDPKWVAANMKLLSDGVLFLGLRFWSQKTQSWAPANGETGPETRWDSTRFRDKEFDLKRSVLTVNDPLDDILPHRVEVTITLERPVSAGQAVSKLNSDIDRATTVVAGDLLPAFPQGPGFVKIDDEWMSYETRSGSSLSGVKRGIRGTAQASHKKDSAMRYGETFTTVVGIPAFKDDQNP